ncbi:MAG TPA: papain-like cysteine protease family protein [Bradyrhizobium sp.]
MRPAADETDSLLNATCIPIELPPLRRSRWRLLDFKNEHQEKTNWCWAAVAASVAHFYRPSSRVTQCDIANGQLGRSDCCVGGKDACNVYGYLMSSLFRVGHFRKWTARRSASLRETQEEIGGRRPLCVRIVWNGGGAHLVTIKGYSDEPAVGGPAQNDYGLAIADPWWGLSDIDAEQFPRGYVNCGTWTDTYYTKRATA